MDMLDTADLDDVAIATHLARLEEDEARVSRKRTSLHKRIDFLATGGYADPAAAADQLADLRSEERELSERRLALHGEIERLRAELVVRRRGVA
jgi:hypothetical protein